jgi:hypothetical protein
MNNQAAPVAPTPPPPMPGDTKPPFRIPGLEWLAGSKGDGVIADPAAELDPKSGVHANPISDLAGLAKDGMIYTPAGIMVTLADYVMTMASGSQPASQKDACTSSSSDL